MKRFIGILVVIVGAALFFEPEIAGFLSGIASGREIKSFQETAVSGTVSDVSDAAAGKGDEAPGEYSPDGLYARALAYNEDLYAGGQEVNDAWTYAQAPFGISGIDGTMFGYIEIPAMGVTLPLYIGASNECLAKGACVMGGTSLPIGGENTNAVIAGHRGYRGIPFFRDIEDLAVGDAVYVTNPWGTLTYRVESIKIVYPDETDEILIQPGRDMVTLLTCHPYRGHGKYRYLVCCVRDEGEDIVDTDADTGVYVSDGVVFESSEAVIRQETHVRIICALAIIAVCAICLGTGRKKKGNQRR